MLKKYTRTFVYIGLFTFFLSAVISCEKDFTDISTTIISNTDFSTNDTILEIEVTGKDIEKVQADGLGLGGALDQYLLGVYNNSNYEKIEASIISQLSIPTDLSQVDLEYGADTTVVTTIDTVLLRIPYQATLLGNDASGPNYQLDSIIGNQTTPFTLNVLRLSSFLNTLDPNDPARANSFFSNDNYDVFSEKLNSVEDIQFVPNSRDTSQFVLRKLSTGALYDRDTIRYLNSNPYISIGLKKNRIRELLFDQYESADFASQDAFNDYFRGIKIQAEGNDGSLMSLNLSSVTIQPVIDIYYTNTVFKDGGTTVIDTIKKTDSFLLSGVRNSSYKMTPGLTPAPNKVAVQGTAGTMAQVKILGDDLDNNGLPDQLESLRTQNWLINDATLTFYVDQATVGFDTLATPFRLFLFKDGMTAGGEVNQSQILDLFTEGTLELGGNLELDSDSKPDVYVFKITDYISELVSGDLDYLPPLGLKSLNPTDLPTTFTFTDTIVRTYNWNPKAVMLLNHSLTNGARRAQLKISYSEKTEDN